MGYTCTKAVNTPSRCSQVPKMPGKEGGGRGGGRVSGGGAGAAGSRGHQSESGPSLLSIGFLWREVDCPFLAFRWLE